MISSLFYCVLTFKLFINYYITWYGSLQAKLGILTLIFNLLTLMHVLRMIIVLLLSIWNSLKHFLYFWNMSPSCMYFVCTYATNTCIIFAFIFISFYFIFSFFVIVMPYTMCILVTQACTMIEVLTLENTCILTPGSHTLIVNLLVYSISCYAFYVKQNFV